MDHRIQISRAKLADSGSQAHQDLSSIKCHWYDRRVGDRTALKRTGRHLDADQPVQHGLGPVQQTRIFAHSRLANDGGNDVTGGFRIGCAPATHQAEVACDSAIG